MLEEKVRQVSRGTSAGNFMQHGVTVIEMACVSYCRGEKNSCHKVFLNSTGEFIILLLFFIIDFTSDLILM